MSYRQPRLTSIVLLEPLLFPVACYTPFLLPLAIGPLLINFFCSRSGDKCLKNFANAVMNESLTTPKGVPSLLSQLAFFLVVQSSEDFGLSYCLTLLSDDLHDRLFALCDQTPAVVFLIIIHFFPVFPFF